MSSAVWFTLIGMLLLGVGLTSSLLKRTPLTAAMIYLAVGIIVGPTVLNAFHFNPLKESRLLEVLTEGAVLISLFAAGIKMTTVPSTAPVGGEVSPPAPQETRLGDKPQSGFLFEARRWGTPIILATAAMALCIAMIAGFGWYVVGLPVGAAILLGGILAPTDSVLASDIEVDHATDDGQLRFTLACEAGMNDGTAFPFVMLGLGLLGLHDLGESGWRWLAVDVAWATAAGIAIGLVAGSALAHLGWRLRGHPGHHELLDDFLGLGLIGVVYGVSVMVNAWGFLAVFFAAVALRRTEFRLARQRHVVDDNVTVTSTVVTTEGGDVTVVAVDTVTVDPGPSVSQGALVFKEHLERLSVVVMILLLGGTLFRDSWTWEPVALAVFLFVVARPVSVLLCLLGSKTSWQLRGMSAWYGVRGIGSLYYVMFAIQHGLPESLALKLVQLTLIVVTLSVVVHGLSGKAMAAVLWRRPQAAT